MDFDVDTIEAGLATIDRNNQGTIAGGILSVIKDSVDVAKALVLRKTDLMDKEKGWENNCS